MEAMKVMMERWEEGRRRREIRLSQFSSEREEQLVAARQAGKEQNFLNPDESNT